MKRRAHPPAVITALKVKASIVRGVADDLKFKYVEHAVRGRLDLVRFVFDLDEADTQRLLAAMPLEVYAYRAVIGGGTND